ncbi:serine protease inhibitor Cvsi-2-like [Mercenaria mercenaria]|uniref:serine protease inhibitor Cvsi-2-like n=1 Tax=Mercenaria mercenaria TaxID=6596 RepID=UPI00234E81E9|nr:serine protease inhibitor Cvsi-2-like [Mercenaria mercenaria]
MRTTLLVFAAALVAYTHAENCTTTSTQNQCTSTNCSRGYLKECANNVCTCSPNTCTTQGDCANFLNCNNQWHCVDNGCRCY